MACLYEFSRDHWTDDQVWEFLLKVNGKMNKKAAILGAGPMGLTCAYEMSKLGFTADVFEREHEIGGMSAHFDFSGVSVEKFYHYITKCDNHLIGLLQELDLYKHLNWTETRMGFYYNGKLYKWGGPFELLQFKGASLIEKARYGFHIFYCGKLKDSQSLDNITAVNWIKKWEGENGYLKFWDNLFRLKFDELKDTVSASWFWSRISILAQSRKNIFQETLGYLCGGSLTLLRKLQDKIEAGGGRIYLDSTVENINFQNNKIDSLTVNGKRYGYDIIVSTIPLQYLNRLTRLPANDAKQLKCIDNVGCVCVAAKINTTVTNNFITNIADERLGVTGIIDYSNLNLKLDIGWGGGGGGVFLFYNLKAKRRYKKKKTGTKYF
jgi:protoporphyrinogen oxidase